MIVIDEDRAVMVPYLELWSNSIWHDTVNVVRVHRLQMVSHQLSGEVGVVLGLVVPTGHLLRALVRGVFVVVPDRSRACHHHSLVFEIGRRYRMSVFCNRRSPCVRKDYA